MTSPPDAQVEAALLPCPFCGTPARVVNDSMTGFRIECRSTNCFGPVTSWYGTYPDAKAAWNRRTALTAAFSLAPAGTVEPRLVKAEADRTVYAQTLKKLRSTLHNVTDAIEDEGDRYYFGSTNDADELKAIADQIEGLVWDEIMEQSEPPRDLYAEMRALNTALREAKAKISDLEAALLPPQPSAVTEAQAAYGLLWRMRTTDKAIHEARRSLLSAIGKDGQRAGLDWALATFGPHKAPTLEELP